MQTISNISSNQKTASKPAGSASIFNLFTSQDYQELKLKQLGDAQAVADSVDLGELVLKDTDPGTIVASVYYFHPDHLRSSIVITDGAGYAYQIFLNLPFGETLAEQRRSGSLNNPFKFNGKELDSETGLYYYGARYYDPRISLFISVDPLAEQTMTPYQYTYQNPVRYIDPTGMAPEHIDPTAIYFTDYKNKLYIPNMVEAWEFFASSKIGINFLKDFAQAGQTIGGHTYKEDGKYHKKGINLILGTGVCTTEFNKKYLLPANGLTISVIRPNGNLDITIDIENNSKTEYNLSTLLHEFLIHTIPSAKDFYDNKKLDFSNGYPKWYIDYINENWSEKNKTNKRLIDHRIERNQNRQLEKFGVPIMQDFYKLKGNNKNTETIKNEMYQYAD
jgi:RHS repeat-associated protein